MTYRKNFARTAAALLILGLCSQKATAQVIGTLNYWNQATGNWNVPANWSLGIPNGQTTDDFAVIGGTATGVGISTGAATVNSVISQMAGGVSLGNGLTDNGTLTIASGGNLTVADTPFDGTGNVYVGFAGKGFLNVDRGGTLTAQQIIVGGGSDSSLRLGGVAGSGSATVNATDAILARTTRVIGPNVTFTASGQIALQASSNFIAQITGPTHSALKATSRTVLGGSLTAEITGVAPALGNTWNLFDTATVVGSFASVNAATAPPLPVGQVYDVRTVNGGTNGKLVQLAVEQRLVLEINRNTNAITLKNVGASGISLDGLSISSPTVNALTSVGWAPIDGNWQVGNSSSARLTQTRSASFLTVAANGSTALGSVFAPPAPATFGNYTDDLTFEYTQPDGNTYRGVVTFVGSANINNLALLINPATGETAIRNTSPFSVNIDAYTMTSLSSSVSAAEWNSLDDQNAAGGNWDESNLSATRLSELKPGGVTTLAPGTTLAIGNAFDETKGGRDVSFQYLLQGEQDMRTGVVVYGAITAPITPGDFNGDGFVNSTDLTKWRGDYGANAGSDANGDGKSDGADLLVWQKNFGAAPATQVAATVPEPASLSLLTAAAVGVIAARRKRTIA